MPLLSHTNSTALPRRHWGDEFAPLAFRRGFYSSETWLGSISLGYFWKIALMFFAACWYSGETFQSSFWFSGCLFIRWWPKIAHTCSVAENTELLLEMGTISSFGKLSPVVDKHRFPEFIWKSVNYLKFSHTPTDIDGVFENTNCKTNVPSKSPYSKACP